MTRPRRRPRRTPTAARPATTACRRPTAPTRSSTAPDVDAPRHPGLLDQAQRPFTAAGPRRAAGTRSSATTTCSRRARCRRRPRSTRSPPATGSSSARPARCAPLPRGEIDAAAGRRRRCSADPSQLPTHRVPADRGPAPGRAGRGERGARPPERRDYTVDIGPSRPRRRGRHRQPRGRLAARISPPQLAWLRRQLRHGPLVVVFSHNPLDAGARRCAVLDATRTWSRSDRRQQPSQPHHPRTAGYWLIGTSSLADFPQQARMFRLRETTRRRRAGDVDGRPRRRGLAGVARELAYLDAQGGRPQDFAGTRGRTATPACS